MTWFGCGQRRYGRSMATQTADVDDRALKAGSHLSAEDALRVVQASVQTTTDLDRAIGLREHLDKRQIWQAGEQVAHLGFVVDIAMETTAMTTRDWWPEHQVLAVAGVPGDNAARASVMVVLVLPKIFWAAGFAGLPELRYGRQVTRSCLSTKLT